jgi:nitrogen fixation protein FixH
MTPSSALPANNPRVGIDRFLPHWVPMLFAGAFLVVIGVNATLIYFAQDTFSGLETASPYERGLDYNKALAAEAAQNRLGWQLQTQISSESDGTRSLLVHLTDRDGRALDGLAIVAHLVRPSTEGLDTIVIPRPLGDGRYGTSFVLPAAGQWELRLVAQGDDVAWQHSERLFVK